MINGMGASYTELNAWPLVQFRPMFHANFNHPDQGMVDDFHIDCLLKEFRESRGLNKALQAVERMMTEIQNGL